MSIPSLHVANGIATIQLNRPSSLNALTRDDYEFISEVLRKVDKMPDILKSVPLFKHQAASFAPVLMSVHAMNQTTKNRAAELHFQWARMQSNTDLSDALYSHSKVLVALLNGPAVGIAAAMLGHFDFIYAMPQAWIAVPFSFLGLSAEQNASVTFANRMGLAKATEALLWGKKMTAEELEKNGFINKIFPGDTTESFHEIVRAYLLDRLDGLDPGALLSTKRMIQTAVHEKNDPRATNLRESFAQAERFAGGVPALKFGQLARKEIKHRL